MGVLHVVDRVVHGLLLDQFQVEVELGVGLAGQEHEAGGVGSDFVHNVFQGLELSGAGGHGNGFARFEQVDQIDQDDAQAALFAESLARGHHARHVAVMVRAPDVHHEVEAPFEFVVVVGDVGREIGGVAVAFAQHAVLVVAQLGGLEPVRTVRFVAHAGLGEVGKGFIHLAVRHQRFFREPDVVAHAKGLQIFLDTVQDVAHAVVFADLHGFFLGQVEDVGIGGQHVAGDVDDVFAPVVVCGFGHVFSGQFLESVPDGRAEDEHLSARVIDVVFGLDLVSGHFHDADQRVAQGCASAVADMQRSCGVGGNIFHLHLGAVAQGGRAVVAASLADGGHGLAPERRREGEIQKSRTGDVDLFDKLVVRQGFGKLLGNGSRGFFGLLGQHHGHVGRHITELLVLGRLDHGFIRPVPALVGQDLLQLVFQMYFGSHAGCILLNKPCGPGISTFARDIQEEKGGWSRRASSQMVSSFKPGTNCVTVNQRGDSHDTEQAARNAHRSGL